MTKRMIVMLLFVLAILAALAGGFFLHIQHLMASAPKPTPQTVSTTKASHLSWQPQINSIGSLVSVRGVDVTTELAGLVREVNFKSGQDVKAGAVLVQLNADSDVAALHVAQAAAELADIVYKRDKAQLEVKAVSQAQVDADGADLKSKQAQVAQQQALVDKKTIRAPFSGRLGIATLMPGQYLNAGDKIVTLQSLDPIYVDFNLPQQRLAQLHAGEDVELSVDALPGQVLHGHLSAINPKVDATTRNVQVEATLANPHQDLLPGMFAKVAVNVGKAQERLTLPQTAITFNPYGSTVFLVKADPKNPGGLVAQQVFVTTGDTRGDQVTVLQGVQDGDQVVTSGQIKLKNNVPVQVDNSVLPANSPNPTPQEH